MEDKPKSSGIECPAVEQKHFTCSECLHSHVMACVNAGRENPDILQTRQGRVFCPSFGVDCDCEKPLGHSQIAGFVPESVFDDYLSSYHQMAKQQALHEVQAQVQAQMLSGTSMPQQAATPTEEESEEKKKRALAKISQHLLAQQLQVEMGGRARMCGRCAYGPVDHKDCDDLTSHHMQDLGNGVRISNACARCDWFSSNVQDWPMWDGKLPDDTEAEESGVQERLQSAVMSDAPTLWACGTCSFHNNPDDTICEICSTPSSAAPAAPAALQAAQEEEGMTEEEAAVYVTERQASLLDDPREASELALGESMMSITAGAGSSAAPDAATTVPLALARGCEVTIHSLVRATELNGTTAIILRQLDGKNREAYEVEQTGSGEGGSHNKAKRFLRRENLRVVSDRRTTA
jgi:transcription elongation factor Elf1